MSRKSVKNLFPISLDDDSDKLLSVLSMYLLLLKKNRVPIEDISVFGLSMDIIRAFVEYENNIHMDSIKKRLIESAESHKEPRKRKRKS